MEVQFMGIQDQMRSFAETAVKYAESFNVELDYSKGSILEVEKILDYSQDLKRCNPEEKPTEKQIWSMATIWGAYIGEVMRQELGSDFQWTNEETFGNRTPHIRKAEMGTFPIDKVYKRLVNGVEDNTVTYFDVSMDHLKEECEWSSGHVLYIKGDGSNGHTIR
jgi:hypothetical protein